MELTGKTAVVTGAGRGIGREIALALASAGADVVLAARSVDALESVAEEVADRGGSALVVPTDVTRPVDIDRLVGATANRFGGADIVVNNSGIAGSTARTWETDIDVWEQTIAVNLTGPWLMCRGFIPQMIERGGGSIVNIGSITGKRPFLGRSPYAATKAGLIGLTRTVAEEAGPHGIRVNLISPGAVEGPRIDAVFDAQAAARGVDAAEVRSEFEQLSPLGRLVTVDDVARATLYLASDASAGITGIDLNVTTGMVMY